MKLYIIRHGEPDYAVDGLTQAGHREAKALAKRMKTVRPHRLYTSPLGRARSTAQYTEKSLGKKSTVLEWARELSWETHQDPWGRLMAWDTPGEVIRGKAPYPSYGEWDLLRPLRGLGFRDGFDHLTQESDSFLEGLGYRRMGGRYKILKSNRDKVAVFCHGGFGLTWLAHLLEIPLALMWSGFNLAPSSVSTVLFDERSPEWAVPRCLGVGDLSHLYAEGLPVSPHGIKGNLE
jgi:broad specificity phosphatase PhoE